MIRWRTNENLSNESFYKEFVTNLFLMNRKPVCPGFQSEGLGRGLSDQNRVYYGLFIIRKVDPRRGWGSETLETEWN